MMTSRNLFRDPGSRLYTIAMFWLKVPPRSATGSTSCQLTGPVGQSYDRDHGMIHLDVRTLSGAEFGFSEWKAPRSQLGSAEDGCWEHFPVGSGAKLVLDHMRHQTRILARMDDYSGVARRPRPWSGA